MDPEIIKQFCLPSDLDYKGKLSMPFRIGESVYATDGHILIRVPADEYTGKLGEGFDTAHQVFEQAYKLNLSPLPDFEYPPALPDPTLCVQCSGTGEIECGECGAYKDCHECNGLGVIDPHDSERNASAKIGASIFDAHYLRILSQLPGLKIATRHDADDSTLASYFTFNGGDGLIMPLRSHLSTIIKEKAA